MSYPRHFGDYLLLEHLGTGGMSEVDLARREVGKGAYVRFMVIKRISAKNLGDERHIRMFQDEARINSELHHENIAQVYDFGELDDEFFLAMEYVPGMDLREIQRTLASRWKRRLPLREALTILRGVLLGLDYAHRAMDTLGRPMNVVHRDVNPRNIMVSLHGDVKLIDFGVAKANDKLDETRTHGLKGKFAYMAPEQVQSKEVDGRTDLFAAGLVLQELVNGVSPFAGLNEVQVIHKLLKGDLGELQPDPAYKTPELLESMWHRALAKRMSDRYPTGAAFVEDLDKALEPIGGPCTKKRLSIFVHAVDSDRMADITLRLARYHAGDLPDVEPPEIDAATGSISLVEEEELDAATRTLLLAPAAASQSSVAQSTGSQYRTGTLVAAAGGGVIAALLLVLVGAGAAWWWLNQRTTPSVFESLSDPVVAPADPVEEEQVAEDAPTEPALAPGELEPEEAGVPAEPETAVARVPWIIYSQPKGQELYVNGARAGMTPKRLMLTEGEHDFAIRNQGGKSISVTVEVRRDASRNSTTLVLPP
jgi:serine/threonine protein kinase